MERENESQTKSIQEQIKTLTKMVNQTLREKDLTADLQDPYFTERIPVTDLTVYPELTNSLPSIEEDFLRPQLTEEERKLAIHS
ncbi:hypothetical protein AYI68_g7298 [Smittium mucronatum]|uniref:Uncharacterized protein n=1 Tax=Smittium mucronatum TaxID=133383 RepID=A0A1R0GP44_9FUNG|nr:hypothetical protein AYI68_g7298 [Smittium mucronatum]